MDTSIYNITENRSVVVIQTSNDQIYLYLVIKKVKNNFFI